MAEKCFDKYETTKNGKTNNKKKTKKWFHQICLNLRKKVKMSANKKHALPNQLNINHHKDLLKQYKRLGRHKQIEFWNKETERIKKEE